MGHFDWLILLISAWSFPGMRWSDQQTGRSIVSSTYTRSSEKCDCLTVMSGFDHILLRIQSIAIEKSIGARTHPCLTPKVIWNQSGSCFRCLILALVPSWSDLIGFNRKWGIAVHLEPYVLQDGQVKWRQTQCRGILHAEGILTSDELQKAAAAT